MMEVDDANEKRNDREQIGGQWIVLRNRSTVAEKGCGVDHQLTHTITSSTNKSSCPKVLLISSFPKHDVVRLWSAAPEAVSLAEERLCSQALFRLVLCLSPFVLFPFDEDERN